MLYMNKTNNYKKLLPYIIPIPLIFIMLLYLYTQDGAWFYLDAAYELVQKQNKVVLSQFFHTFTTQTYFGYDPSYITPPRLLYVVLEYIPKVLFGSKTGLIIYLFTSFYLAFLFTFKSLRYEYKITPSLFGALVFAFNPFSVNQISVPGFTYTLFGLPMLFYAISYYIHNRKFSLPLCLVISIGLYSLLSYPRIAGVSALLLLPYSLLHISTILKTVKNDWWKIIKYSVFIFLSILPFTTALFLSIGGVQKDGGGGGFGVSKLCIFFKRFFLGVVE